jgi:opacity protein-like surface antigen
MPLRKLALPVVLLCLPLFAAAQQPEQTYSRLNTFSAFTEYSNDSTHIILGTAMNRKIGALGFQYQRRLVHRRPLDLYYEAEIRPAMLESDPMQHTEDIQTSPQSDTYNFGPDAVLRCNAWTLAYSQTIATSTGTVVIAGTEIQTCPRRTVIEQGFAPAGIRINLAPRHRLQLTFSTNAGYMFSTQEVPVPSAGAFNYTFDFGGGLEYSMSRTRSVRLEYQVQHFSNKQTAYENPGVDSGFIKLTFGFGR